MAGSACPFGHTYADKLDRLTAIVAVDPPDPAGVALLAAMVGASVLGRTSTDGGLGNAIKAAVLGLARSVDEPTASGSLDAPR